MRAKKSPCCRKIPANTLHHETLQLKVHLHYFLNCYTVTTQARQQQKSNPRVTFHTWLITTSMSLSLPSAKGEIFMQSNIYVFKSSNSNALLSPRDFSN